MLFIQSSILDSTSMLHFTLFYTTTTCSDEPLTVQLPGTQTRSFCYVSDMVRFHSSCLFNLFSWLKTLLLLPKKIDGLTRLMEGDHIGPINIGNPGQSSVFLPFLIISISYPGSRISNSLRFIIRWVHNARACTDCEGGKSLHFCITRIFTYTFGWFPHKLYAGAICLM